MFHSPPPSKRTIALLLLLVAAIAATFAMRSPTVASALQTDPVTAAWEKARASGSYHFESDVTQITIPSAKITNVGRRGRIDQLRLEGKTNLEERSLEVQLWSQNGSVAQQQSALHVKVENGKTYTRNATGEWKESQDLSLDGLAPEADFMGYLRAIRNVQAHAPESRAGINFTRYSFTIDGSTYALYMHSKIESALRAKGELPPNSHLEVSRYHRDMIGEGELWIGEDGFPIRQVLSLQFPEQNDESINAQIKISFSKFGEDVQIVRNADFGVRISDFATRHSPLSILLFTSVGLVLLVLRFHRVRKLQNAIAIAVIVSFVVGPILSTISNVSFLDAQTAKAATAQKQQEQSDAEQSLQEAMDQVPFNPHEDPVAAAERNLLANAQQAAVVNGGMSVLAVQATAVITTDNGIDTDRDGLSDFVEQRVGTDYTYADSDEDKIADGVEVKGFTLGGKTWYANALEADSNNDGIADTIERDANGDNTPDDTDNDGTPDLFDFDNDNDAVPDNKDSAPFSASSNATPFSEANPLKLTLKNLTAGKPTFVDFQIRPKDSKHLWFAFNVLDWPQDPEGQVRDIDGKTYADTGSNATAGEAYGDMKLVPMLELRIPSTSANLPPTSDLTPYNITVNNLNSSGTTKSVYVPLSIITNEKTGERVAFSGRMRYLPTGVWTLAHEVRLAWVVQALVDMPCDHTDPSQVAQGCAEDDYIHNVGQVIQSYYDDFSLTGLNISEDNGASVAVVYEDPAVDSNVLDDAPLSALAAGLDSAFLAARDKDNNGVRDMDINELARRFNRTTNSTVPVQQRWSIPNTLRVEKIDYATSDQAVIYTAMTETKRILNANFTSPWQNNSNLKPLLMYTQEQRARNLGLDGIKTPGGFVTQSGSDLVFDLAPAGQTKVSLDIMTSVKWTPYCAPAGGAPSWDACAPDVYWQDLEARYGAAQLAGDPANDSSLASGRTAVMQLFVFALMQGISRVVQRDNVLVSSVYSLKSDGEIEVLARTGLSVASIAVKSIANLVIMAYYVNQVSMAKHLGDTLKSAGLSKIGQGLQNSIDILKNFRSGGHLNRLAGTGIVAAAAVLIVGLAIAGYFFAQAFANWSPEVQLGVKITIKVLITAISTYFSVISPIKSAVEWAGALKSAGSTTSILKSSSQVIGNSQKAGAIGMVVSVAVTWGFFIYSVAANNVSAFSAEYNKALAETIAATLYYVMIFVISATVIGTIIAGIISVIDAILTAICELGVDDLRTVPGLGGACFTLGNGAIKLLAYLIYNYDSMIDTERNDLVVMGIPKVGLADPNKGFVQGNGISVSMPVTTTAVHKSPDAANGLIINVYLWLFSPDNLRSTTFKYTLSQAEQSLGVERDQMKSAWQNVGVDHYYAATPMYRGQAVANPIPQVTGITRPAGLNRTTDFYFNSGFALPAYECWIAPIPYGPIIIPTPICYARTLAGSNSTKIDTMKFDIFPATLDEFMKMDIRSDGGWGMNWDPAFLSLADADGDGLIALNRGGIDPNNNNWDTDSDGLADSYELERRQAGVNYSLTLRDSDSDGLTDLQEAQYNANPTKADSDGDGLKDAEEVWHERIDSATGAATGIWEGGWDITINATTPFVVRVSSNPTQKDSDLDGVDDLAERALALDPVAANRLDLDNRPYSPIIPNSPLLVILGESNDLDRVLGPNQSFIYTSTVIAMRRMNPGTLNLTVPSVLGVPSPASPYALGFNPLTFNTAQTLTVQTNLKVIANPLSQIANIGSRAQATLNPSNGGINATGNYTIAVDNDKPTAQLTSLPNNGYIRSHDSILTYHVIGGIAADATSYPTLVRVNASTLVGSSITDATGTSSWAATVGIRPGTNTIHLYVRDAVGHETTTPAYTIYGDGLAPEPRTTITSTVTTRNRAGQWVVQLKGTVIDPITILGLPSNGASGVDPASLRVQLSPDTYNARKNLTEGSLQPVVYNVSNGTWSVDYVLPSDVTDLPPSAFYRVLFYASDKVGNHIAGYPMTNIRVDARPPVAALTLSDAERNILSASITTPGSIGGEVLDPAIDANPSVATALLDDKIDLAFAPITHVLAYSGTVLQLNFEDQVGFATFADSSGQANHAYCGTTTRCPQLGVAGRSGNGLQTSTNTSFSIVKNHPSLNFPQSSAQSFSAQGWIKLGNETSQGFVILEKAGNRGGYGLGIVSNVAGAQGRAYWQVASYRGGPTAGTVTVTGNRDLRDNQWHHLMGVYDRQQQLATLYVDGVAVGSAASLNGDYGDWAELRDMTIASSTFGRAATIDQIAVWNRALTAYEVQAMYRAADKVWYPATVFPPFGESYPETWKLPVPNNLEGMYQIDGRSTDYLDNKGQNNNLWRGIIDVVAPRVTISGTATGQSVLDSNNVRQYEVKYSCVALDWQLDESKFNCPGNAIQPASRAFNSDPILQSQFPTLTILSTLTNTWTVWQPSNIPSGTLTACDTTGKCSTSVLGGGLVAASGELQAADGKLQVASEESASITNYQLPVAAAEVAAVPSEQPNAEIINPTDGSFVGSAGVVEVTVAAEAAKALREVTVLLDGEEVATLPFARIDKMTVAQQSVSIPMGAGEHTLEARATDWAGNVQPAGTALRFMHVTKDPTVALAKTNLTISDTYQAQSGVVIIQGTVDDTTDNLATVQVKVGDQPYADALVNDGAWGVAYPVIDPEDRSLAISVRAIDKAGNISKIGEEATTDFNAGDLPETTILTTPSNPSSETSATFAFTGTINSDFAVAYECQLDDGAFTICSSPVSYSDLSNGSHSFRVHAINGQGTQDPTPAEFKWSVKGAGVEAKIGQAPSAETNSRSATFDFSGGSEYECSLEGAAFTACTSPVTYSNLADGNHLFQVRVKGNPASKHVWRITNVAPIAISQILTTAQNANLSVQLLANDESTLQYSIVHHPANGSLSGVAPNLTYQPATDFFGSDSFTFKADDGDATSNVATVVINVTPAPGQAGVERGNFVLFGQEGVIVRENVKVLSGDIAASLSSQGPWLGEGAEVSIGRNVMLAGGNKVMGDTIFVSEGTALGDVNYNELRGPGTANGTKVSPQPLPLLNRFVSMPAIVKGKANADAPANGNVTLAAGSYLDLNVGDGATVVFSGGMYHFQSWNVGKNTKLHFMAKSEVRISGRVLVNERGYVGPALSSTVTASQIVIYVAGTNANVGNLGGLGIKSATFGPFATLAANVVAPNGTLLIRERSKAVGSFVGRWVSVGKFSELSLDNRFNTTSDNANASLTIVTTHETLLAGAEAGIQSQAQLSADADAELAVQEGSNEVDPVIAPPDTITPPDTTTPDAGLNNKVYLPVISSGSVGQSSSQTVDSGTEEQVEQSPISNLQSPVSEEAVKLVFLPLVNR